MSAPPRRPIAEVNAERNPFPSASDPFFTAPPGGTSWKVGSGLNSHSEADKFSASTPTPFKTVRVGSTDTTAGAMYKLMLGGISPRPVALVGTYSDKGVANLAPISWYQMVSHDPPLVMVSFGGSEARRKDSEVNLRKSGEYCISMSSEPLAEALNYASIDAPPGVSEFALSGLTPVPGKFVHAPRVGESPYQMELKVDFVREWKNDKDVHTTTMVVGRVQAVHVREDCLVNGTVDPTKALPISRFSGLMYGRTGTGYELERPKYDEAKEEEAIQHAIQEGPKQAPERKNDVVLKAFP